MIPWQNSGGCLCGKVTFGIRGCPTYDANQISTCFCHCRMCQRASGSPVMTFAAFKVTQVTWTQEIPKEYRSSPRARRLFCGTCGSQLGMRTDESQDIIYLPITSLDNPDTVPPQRHIYWPDHRPWLQLADTLPRHAKGTIED